MALKSNGLEASFYYYFNPMVRKSCMDVKLGLVTIRWGVLRVKILYLNNMRHFFKKKKNETKKKGAQKGAFLKWCVF